MKKILIALLVCTSLISCSKDEDIPNGSGNESYKPDNIIVADEAVMYTENGIIHDKTLIKDYLTRRGVASHYAIDQTIPPASDFSSYTLTFEDDKHVLIGKQRAEITDKKDTLMMIELVAATVPEVGKKSVTDSLLDMVDKYGPLSECPTYYTAPCSYRRKYPVMIAGGKYYIPYVVATASTNVWMPTPFGVPMDYTIFSHRAGETMVFNPAVTTKLGGTLDMPSGGVNYILDRNDTLVIQTLRQGLIRQ